ncbi:MAG: hypothetical protein GY696_28590, partial [Gammaproteobacteria bacterium]|nr:hypothetical protein [Gammaproteobacteria bacterium]
MRTHDSSLPKVLVLSSLREGVVVFPVDPTALQAAEVELRPQEGEAMQGIVSRLSPITSGTYSAPLVHGDRNSELGLVERSEDVPQGPAAAHHHHHHHRSLDAGAGVHSSTQGVEALLLSR